MSARGLLAELRAELSYSGRAVLARPAEYAAELLGEVAERLARRAERADGYAARTWRACAAVDTIGAALDRYAARVRA